jgi:hypothetical protein
VIIAISDKQSRKKCVRYLPPKKILVVAEQGSKEEKRHSAARSGSIPAIRVAWQLSDNLTNHGIQLAGPQCSSVVNGRITAKPEVTVVTRAISLVETAFIT